MKNQKGKKIRKTTLQSLQEVAVRDALVFSILVVASSVVMGSFLAAILSQTVKVASPVAEKKAVNQPEGRVEAETMSAVYDCADPHPDWLFCEDWENLSENIINQNEKECIPQRFWGEGGSLCYKPDKWQEWSPLGANTSGDYEGISSEFSFSGDYSLKLSNDPACDCPDSSGRHPAENCGYYDGDPDDESAHRVPCDQPRGGNAGYVTAVFNAEPKVYARTYIKWGPGYDINHGFLSTGKGFYLWDNSDNSYNFHFECRSSLPGSPTWGGDFLSEEGEKSYAALTWYDRSGADPDLCWGGDCFVLPDEPALCEEFLDDKWHAIEMMGDIGSNTLALWIDGRKRAEYEVSSTFHGPSADGFGKIELTNHYHGGVPRPQSIYWDDIVASSSYIGPAACPDSEEIQGACYCGGLPVPEDDSNVYASGYCCSGQWQDAACPAVPDLEANLSCPDAHLGRDFSSLVTVINQASMPRDYHAHIDLEKCDGVKITDFRHEINTVEADSYVQKKITIKIPRRVAPQWMNCDFRYDLWVEDLATGEMLASDSCIWRIVD